MSPLWAPLSLLLLAGLADGLAFNGTCPPLTAVDNFQLNPILGKWYRSEQYPIAWEKDLRCMFSVYRKSGDGSNELSFTIVAVGPDGKVRNATGKIHPVLRNSSAFVPSFRASYDPNSTPTPDSPIYKIVAVNYSSHFIMWHCRPHHDKTLAHRVHFRSLFVMTRSRLQDQNTNQTIAEELRSMDISRSDLTSTDQKNCPGDVEALI